MFDSLPGVSSSLTKTPLSSTFACSCGAASAAAPLMGLRLDGAAARACCEPSTSPSAQRRCSCSSGGKRVRLLDQGGVGAALNPSSIGAPDGRSVFSRANIARSVAESARVWEQTDRDAALAARLNAGAATQQSQLPSLSSGSPVPPQTCTMLAGSLSTLAAGGSVTSDGNDGIGPASPPAPSACGRFALVPAGGLPGSIDQHALTSALAAARGDSCFMGAAAATGGRASLGGLAAAGQWQGLYDRLAALGQGVFVTGGPGVGKSTFLRGFHERLLAKWPHAGEVIIIAPTGSAAKTANGQTYHSFFGFPRDYRMQHADPVAEAARLLKEDRFRPISRRLALVRVLLLDEVSMVAAHKFDVMVELLKQARSETTPACQIFTFGDFLQLGPLGGGDLAFTSRAWKEMCGTSMLELTLVHRQSDPGFVRAINDARYGICSSAVTSLMAECAVTDQQYDALRGSVLHVMPRHEEVELHNSRCLAQLCGGLPPRAYVAVDTVEQDKDRDAALPPVHLHRVTEHSRNAALVDCVAPRLVLHCLGARVMLTSNLYLALGFYHGSIGYVSAYKTDGAPVVRFEQQSLPSSVGRGMHGVHDAGEDWLEVECPPVAFEARIMAYPGVVAVRRQVPFVLGWGITVYRSQSLSLSEAVLDIALAFGPGMVNAAISRVRDKKRMYVKSFTACRLFADPVAVKYYREGTRV